MEEIPIPQKDLLKKR